MASNNNEGTRRLRLPSVPRLEEEAILHEAFQNVLEHHSRIQMVLVGGASGTGKATLVNRSLASFQAKHRKAHNNNNNNNNINNSNGNNTPLFFHATTKFDQRQSTAPLAGLRQLLTDLMQAAHTGQFCCAAVQQRLTSAQVKVLKGFAMEEGMLGRVRHESGTNGSNTHTEVAAALEASAVVEEEYKEEIDHARDMAEITETNTKPTDSTSSFEDASERSMGSIPSVNVDDFSQDGLTVLTTTLKAYSRAVASVSPVLLQLEGLQWGCRTTMELLESIVTGDVTADAEDESSIPSSCIENLCVVATFRANEDSANEHFYAWKDELQNRFLQLNNTDVTVLHEQSAEPKIKKGNTESNDEAPAFSDDNGQLPSTNNFHVLDLDNLELSSVQQMLADATSREISDIETLADVVYKFTHGNLFFLRHFVEKLQDDGLLVFNETFFRWEWDTEKIKRRSSISSNVLQVLASRLHKLPQPVQNVLTLAACFGNQFDVRALEVAKTAFDGINCVEGCLNVAMEQEFVIPLTSSNSSGKQYKFCHDMIQMTAYGLVPEEVELGQIHWDVGCLLLENGKHLWKTDDSILFSTVDHVNIGVNWIESPSLNSGGACLTKKWRIEVARINYLAGVKAASLSAFYPAAQYLDAAIKALGGGEDPANAFSTSYQLALKVFNMFAKTKYCVGDLKACRKAADLIMEQTKTCHEKHAAFSLVIKCYVAEHDTMSLVNFCTDTLVKLGEKIYDDPSTVYVQLEYQKMKHRLNSLSDDDILRLPDIKNGEKEFAMMLMSHLIFPLYHLERTGTSTLFVARMVQLTLKYGICETSAYAFSVAGLLFAGTSHDIKGAFRLAQLTEKTIRTRLGGMTTRRAEIMALVATGSRWWFEPLSNTIDVFIENYKTCMQSGEVGAAFQSIVVYVTNYYSTGLPLEPLLRDVEKYARQFLEYNHTLHFLLILPLWQCLLNLTGKSDDPLEMTNGKVMLRRQSVDDPTDAGVQAAQSYQMQLAFYLGDLSKATELASIVSGFKAGMMKCSHWYYTRRFFFTLIAISNFRLTHHRKDKVEAEKHLKIFRTVVKAGAINLVHKLQLLEAEMLPLERHTFSKESEIDKQALELYDHAIVSASRAGFIQDAALANYLCFQYIQRRQVRVHLAEMYLKKSFELWTTWGAVAVAESLAARHKDIFSPESVKSLSSSRNSKTGSYRGRERFDATVSDRHKALHLVDE